MHVDELALGRFTIDRQILKRRAIPPAVNPVESSLDANDTPSSPHLNEPSAKRIRAEGTTQDIAPTFSLSGTLAPISLGKLPVGPPALAPAIDLHDDDDDDDDAESVISSAFGNLSFVGFGALNDEEVPQPRNVVAPEHKAVFDRLKEHIRSWEPAIYRVDRSNMALKKYVFLCRSEPGWPHWQEMWEWYSQLFFNLLSPWQRKRLYNK